MPEPSCACDLYYGFHRWNCEATPIWAATMRALDFNPWTHLSRQLAALAFTPIHINTG